MNINKKEIESINSRLKITNTSYLMYDNLDIEILVTFLEAVTFTETC